MPYELCRHIMTNGKRCESPALSNEMWCYFHNRLITRHRNLNAIKQDAPLPSLYLPVLEDRESVQVAISLVVDAIVTGVLTEKRAAVLLRAIGIASRNAVGIHTQPYHHHEIVRSFMPTLDGHPLASRRMDDHSNPPTIDRSTRGLSEPDPSEIIPPQPVSKSAVS